jgi:hypothetical protein
MRCAGEFARMRPPPPAGRWRGAQPPRPPGRRPCWAAASATRQGALATATARGARRGPARVDVNKRGCHQLPCAAATRALAHSNATRDHPSPQARTCAAHTWQPAQNSAGIAPLRPRGHWRTKTRLSSRTLWPPAAAQPALSAPRPRASRRHEVVPTARPKARGASAPGTCCCSALRMRRLREAPSVAHFVDIGRHQQPCYSAHRTVLPRPQTGRRDERTEEKEV